MKPIKKYQRLYAACADGRIWSFPKTWVENTRWGGTQKKSTKGKYLKSWDLGRGYQVVSLFKGKRQTKFLVHRLVAQAFIPNPRKCMEVNHKDANRRNNNVRNLEWVTSKENKLHARRLGLLNASVKLTEKQVREIRKKSGGDRQGDNVLAKQYGVTTANIRSITKRMTWKHIL